LVYETVQNISAFWPVQNSFQSIGTITTAL